tara:strand:+ start:4638 stop:5060 length:423 start_codon:yes stop_codon:yes gene_type:complete
MGDYFTFHTVATTLVALALGGMTFFSFALTPSLFLHLDKEVAGPLLGNLFPTYYRLIAAVSLIAAFLIWYRWEAWALGGIVLTSVIAWLYLVPAIERLRPGREAGGAEATSRFGQLHGLSVVLNLAQIAVLFVIFFRLIR